MKKRLIKIWGIGLVAVMLITLLASAVPVSAGTLSFTKQTDVPGTTDKVLQPGTNILDLAVSTDGSTIYAAAPWVTTATLGHDSGGDAAATWSATQKHSGYTSAYLQQVVTDGSPSVYVDITPPTGITFADFEADITGAGDEWSWWNYTEHTGTVNSAQMELKFTDPAGSDFVDINFMQHNVAATDAWAKVQLVAATVAFMNYSPDVGDNSAALEDFATILTNLDDAADDFVLTRVRVELYEAQDKTAYIDDVTIDGKTYDLEGPAGEVAAGEASSGRIYKSTDAGATWTALTAPSGAAHVQMVAVAPDDPDVVAIIADGHEVYVSTNGGSTWSSLGTVTGGDGAVDVLNDIAVAPLSASTRYIAVAGTDDGPGPAVFYFNLGASAPVWKDATSADFTTPPTLGTDVDFVALAFSPNFASDMVLTAVSESGSTTEGDPSIEFHIISFNHRAWNSDAGFPETYPVTLESVLTEGTAVTCQAAEISLDPEYLGGDDSTRIAMIGLAIDKTGDAGGIYRLKDATVEELKKNQGIKSIAWDGTDLVAGSYNSNDVYRCADALATSPTVSGSRGYKEIGVDDGADDQVIVRWAGNNVVGAKSGAASAFGISTDNGKTWNSPSLIDSELTTMMDVWVSPDGSVTYLLARDGDEISLYRKASAWQKVFCLANAQTDWIVRAADSDPDVVYLADRGATTMYYSTDGGVGKWTLRSSRYAVQDLAVQDEDVAYVARSSSNKVSKTTNGGFTWADEKSTRLYSGNIHTINLISDDNLLVGGDAGYVAYSSDGASSWERISKRLSGESATQVTATGLADGDFIFAGTDANDAIERWEIGTSTTWKDMAAPDEEGDYGTYGLVLNNDVLYAITSDGDTNSELQRTLELSTATPSDTKWAEVPGDGDFSRAPSALRASGSTVLWVINTAATPNELWALTDTVATGTAVEISPSAGPSRQRVTLATRYRLVSMKQ